MIRTRTQNLATEAYRRVAKRKLLEKQKEYSSLAHSFPSMILQNGLAQATGFLLAKGEGEHEALLDDLNAVLQSAKAVASTSGSELHAKVIKADLLETMQLTRHSLDASAWIKRYAQGLLKRDGDDKRDAEGE